ncbi:MAG: MFS transporter [Planctomycetes bacterium]|jgi:UMF1 family MFS transporter|nr:MFS transporter [Planctomycetota bacterium]MDP6410667.1 MFS transporter [Planctomycetota bacterium]
MKVLERLALHDPRMRAWALYDWANSGMITVVVTAVFPIYYAQVAAAGVEPNRADIRYSAATALSLALIALMAPFLGVMADRFRRKKSLLGIFLALGASAVAGMTFLQHGHWVAALVLFVLANIGASGSFIFYDSLLPHVAPPETLDRLSLSGYALGYLGGGLLLGLNLAWIQRPDLFGLPSGEGLTPAEATLPTRLAFLSVAVWWVLFSLPLFRHVREPAGVARSTTEGVGPVRETLHATVASLRDLRGFPQATLMLLAFLIYNDGIATIFRMAAIYGDRVGIGRLHLIGAILAVQFLGIPFTLMFGVLARRLGAKASVLLALGVYTATGILAWRMDSTVEFYILAFLIAMVQGGAQALSRSLFASLIPRQRSAEFFSLFAVLDRFAGVVGPAIFSLTLLATGSIRTAILPLTGMFLVGGALLTRVDLRSGRAQARAAEAALGEAG